MRRRWVLAGVLVAFAAGGVVGYVSRGGQGHSDLSQVAAQAHLLRQLRIAHAEIAEGSAYQGALLREFLSLAGAHDDQSGNCSSYDFPKIHVRILSPTPGSKVRSPVVAHLIIDRPLGCYAEYYVSVDGALYEPTPSNRASLVGPNNPEPARRVRQHTRPTCFGGIYDYIRFRLRPGSHVVAIAGGCSQGTEVPQPVSTPVRFTVSG